MAHTLICNLTSAALLAHVLLGCCWHHGHQCSHQLAAAAEVEVAHDRCCAQPQESTHSQAPVGDCGHGDDGCQGARCVFMSAAPGAAAAVPALQHRDALLVGPAAADTSAAGSLLCGEASLAAGCSCPLRIHLLHQVLLI